MDKIEKILILGKILGQVSNTANTLRDREAIHHETLKLHQATVETFEKVHDALRNEIKSRYNSSTPASDEITH